MIDIEEAVYSMWGALAIVREYARGNMPGMCADSLVTLVNNEECNVDVITGAVRKIKNLDDAAEINHAVCERLQAERDALNGELIAKQETIDHLESELDKARNQAEIHKTTAESYLEDLEDVAYRLSVSYNGGGTVNIMRAIQRLQNR
jgi:predicted RNase H-like nuclease (RuvC/YqgF family)